MALEFFWQLPVQGDGRGYRKDSWNRGDYTPAQPLQQSFARTGVRRDSYTFFDHLVQIARAAELTGFDGVYIPQTPAGEEPLIVAGSLASEVRRLKLLPAIAAPLLSAVYTAKIATSFQRLTNQRLALHPTTLTEGPKPWHGHKWSLGEQSARIGEFLDVFKGFWTQAPFDYTGKYYEVGKGGFRGPLAGQQLPQIFLAGESEEALSLSARHADVHILPLAPIPETIARIAKLDALAKVEGRKLRYVVAADLIVRSTSEEAWDVLRGLAADAAPAFVGGARKDAAQFDEHIESENLWGGFDTLRQGSPYGLVGSFEDVATRISEYADVDVTGFIFSSHPHLEEAYRVGERLLPLINARVSRKAA